MALLTGDGDILCSNLDSTISMDDENCTLIATNIEQTADFEIWLQKNGVESFVTNDCITSLEGDPFLSQICDNTDLVDEVTQLDCEIMICDNEAVKNDIKVLRSANSKPDKNMNSMQKINKGNGRHNLLLKNDILLEKVPSVIEFQTKHNSCSFLVKDSDGNPIFVQQSVQVQDLQQVPQTDQTVQVLSFVNVAKDINIMLPQMLTDGGSKIVLCPIQDCTEAFFHISHAKIHSLKHIGIKPYKCDIPNCPWEFYTPFKLTRHKATHSKSKNFICDFKNCNRGFTTIYNLNWHKKNHEKPATLPCPVKDCDKVFQTEKERRSHCKTHDITDAPYRCSITNCNKSFFTQTSLQTHSRSHSHKESDVCCQYPDCGRVFETPYRLKEHLRTHTGQRPYVCNYEDCTWSFTTASKLRRHQSTHTKDRKFHCTIGNCTKSFLRPEHLKDHTLTHIGQRPFECEVCGSSFIGKSAFYVHLKKAHLDQKQEEDNIKEIVQLQTQSVDKPSSDVLLEQAIQSLGVPSDMMLGTGLLPEELLENENFSTVNLRDLD